MLKLMFLCRENGNGGWRKSVTYVRRHCSVGPSVIWSSLSPRFWNGRWTRVAGSWLKLISVNDTVVDNCFAIVVWPCEFFFRRIEYKLMKYKVPEKRNMAISFTTYRNWFTVRNLITFWIRNICYQKSVVSHFEWRWIWGKITASYTFSFFIFILVYLWKMYKYIFSYGRMVSEDRSEKNIEENNPRPVHGIFPASSCRK
jgi:hypothetical protein